jgi:hypothetical protein
MSGSGLLEAGECSTYFEALDWFIDLLEHDEVAAAWERPSALSGYTVGGVAAHAVFGSLLRPLQLLKEPEPTGRLVSVATYYTPNRVEDPAAIDPLFEQLRLVSEDMARQGVGQLRTTAVAARSALATVVPATRAERPIALARIPDGASIFSDYLRTRVLELVVHGDDVVSSIEGFVVEDPPRSASEVSLGVCLELARSRLGDIDTLRAFTRAERVDPGVLRVL